MSKLLHLWKFLSDRNKAHIRAESVHLEGVRKIVSKDNSCLSGLARAELIENLKFVAKSISRLNRRCEDLSLRSFDRLLHSAHHSSNIFEDTAKSSTNNETTMLPIQCVFPKWRQGSAKLKSHEPLEWDIEDFGKADESSTGESSLPKKEKYQRL
ncbi:hypothetical protein STAS_25174 [Striga asiatica]|uniref:DUF3475 domain-containing protein n=1 Tax=Striga asiatica TaxID=4170 RepID=A0A5A7QRM6_STRAF|nr:hypothetical protein STAS_25174 [Striga asiatica]